MWGMNKFSGKNEDFGIILKIRNFFPITYYGLFAVLGFITVTIIACWKLKKFYQVSYDPAMSFGMIAFPLGIVFASIWSSLIGNSANWYSGFIPTVGGLAIQGGLVSGIILAALYFPLVLKKSKYYVNLPTTNHDERIVVKRVSTWVYLDAIFPAVLLGQAIGRWGNFFNYEVFGQQVGSVNYQTALIQISSGNTDNLPMNWLRIFMPGVWHNMWITNGDKFEQSSAYFYQPLFLYESFFNIVFFLLSYLPLHFISQYKAGWLSGGSLLYTGIFRSVTEPMRYKSDDGGGFSFVPSQVLSGLFIVFGISIIIWSTYCGQKWFRQVQWGKMVLDYLRLQSYQRGWILKLLINYWNFYDNLLKTNKIKKLGINWQRLKRKQVIKLNDYVVSSEQTKYYGEHWTVWFKWKIWCNG